MKKINWYNPKRIWWDNLTEQQKRNWGKKCSYNHNSWYKGEIVESTRKSVCRICCRTIPKGVKRYQEQVNHYYGKKGEKYVMMKYCLDSYKYLIKEEIEETKKYIKDCQKNMKIVTRKDVIQFHKKMKEQELLEAI